MSSNLPIEVSVDSSVEVKSFFDKYYSTTVSFPTNQIDAVVGFFSNHGFSIESANSISIVLLNQARADNVNVFELVDSLRGLSDVQLSQVVAQVLNSYREKTSLLGYRVAQIVDKYEDRNILV